MTDHKNLISLEQLESISFGDEDFKIELIEIFLEQIPGFAQNMESFLADNDLTKLAKEAHTAKSSVMVFGMDETGIILKTIQLEAEQGKKDQLNDLVSLSVADMQSASKQLTSLLKTLRP